jgi:N6-adenosine-specific RNA methylase IME4
MKYRTIVADPPWRYNATKGLPTRGYKPSTAEAHYPTMSNAEIAAIPVDQWADDNAHLYLWVTNPRIFGERYPGDVTPITILERWGFRYVTLLTWHKLGSPGVGFHFRGNTEHVLFGVRGRVAIPTAIRQPTLFAAHKGRHSEKPDRFYELVERVSPEPRLELFARRRRFGWDVWGDEAPQEQASQSHLGLEVPV